MKHVIILILFVLSASAYSRIGGDAGGGPSLTFKVNFDASRISFEDMSLVNVKVSQKLRANLKRREHRYTKDVRVVTQKKVKVVIKYTVPELFCRDQKIEHTHCYNSFSIKTKSIYFNIELFSNETLERLQSRKLFSRKKAFVEIAKENLSIDVEEIDRNQFVTVEVL